MASFTDEIACNGDGWTILAQNVTFATIQLEGDGPLLVNVAQSDPGAGVTKGVMLHRLDPKGINTLPIPGLVSGTDIVYGRMKNAETETVRVIGTTG